MLNPHIKKIEWLKEKYQSPSDFLREATDHILHLPEDDVKAFAISLAGELAISRYKRGEDE